MKCCEKNVGTADRIVRVLIGVILIGAAALNVIAAPWSYVILVIGLIILVTGIIGSCTAYSLLGWSTVGKKPEEK